MPRINPEVSVFFFYRSEAYQISLLEFDHRSFLFVTGGSRPQLQLIRAALTGGDANKV